MLDVAFSPNTPAAKHTTGAIHGGHRSCLQQLPGPPFPSRWEWGVTEVGTHSHPVSYVFVMVNSHHIKPTFLTTLDLVHSPRA